MNRCDEDVFWLAAVPDVVCGSIARTRKKLGSAAEYLLVRATLRTWRQRRGP